MSIYCSLVFIKFRLKLNLIVLDLSLVWAELLPSYNSVSNYSLHLCVCVCVAQEGRIIEWGPFEEQLGSTTRWMGPNRSR